MGLRSSSLQASSFSVQAARTDVSPGPRGAVAVATQATVENPGGGPAGGAMVLTAVGVIGGLGISAVAGS